MMRDNVGLDVNKVFEELGISDVLSQSGNLPVFSPADGKKLASVQMHTSAQCDAMMSDAEDAFKAWRIIPAPRRGELIRLLGEILREKKEALGALVSLENGKIFQEGLGEVQEMIDICDFAVGVSRQLYGLTIASERPGHKMREYWQPAGPVGVISAFNFPVAVWAWNTALAIVCGDPVIWKPSEKTPLTAIACQQMFLDACAKFGADAPENLSQLLIGEAEIGAQMVADKRMSVISATGSTAMGRKVAPIVAERFGKVILELGGNNAIIVAPSADLDLAFQAIVFGAVGTCGQRCTSTRRVFIHDDIYDALVPRIKKAYGGLSLGHPMAEGTLVGPLIDGMSFDLMETALDKVRTMGADITGGGRALVDEYPEAFYVNPAVVEMSGIADNVKEETFAPILYVFRYSDLEEAIERQNDVPQGLSSAIFTRDVLEAETFTAEAGSDCGIANVNIGTSGAEIGGAFGGEKETGGGRESGSDAWKGYMRRMTSTLNYSKELPLAQGIKFSVGE